MLCGAIAVGFAGATAVVGLTHQRPTRPAVLGRVAPSVQPPASSPSTEATQADPDGKGPPWSVIAFKGPDGRPCAAFGRDVNGRRSYEGQHLRRPGPGAGRPADHPGKRPRPPHDRSWTGRAEGPGDLGHEPGRNGGAGHRAARRLHQGLRPLPDDPGHPRGRRAQGRLGGTAHVTGPPSLGYGCAMSTSTAPLADVLAALASGDVRVVDLTQPLSERTPVIELPRRSPTRRASRAPSSAATTSAGRRGRGARWSWASTSGPTSTRRSTGSPGATARTSRASRRGGWSGRPW